MCQPEPKKGRTMPTSRTRRRSYNPRRTTPAEPATRKEIALFVSAIAGDEVDLDFIESQPQLVSSGIPQIRCVRLDAMPSAVSALIPGRLRLEYPAALQADDEFEVPINDPAVRNRWGGFLASGVYSLASAPPVPVAIGWTVTPWDSSSVDLNLAGTARPKALVNQFDRAGIQCPQLMEAPIDMIWQSAEVIRLTFSGSLSPGDEIEVTSGENVIICDDGSYLENKTEAIP